MLHSLAPGASSLSASRSNTPTLCSTCRARLKQRLRKNRRHPRSKQFGTHRTRQRRNKPRRKKISSTQLRNHQCFHDICDLIHQPQITEKPIVEKVSKKQTVYVLDTRTQKKFTDLLRYPSIPPSQSTLPPDIPPAVSPNFNPNNSQSNVPTQSVPIIATQSFHDDTPFDSNCFNSNYLNCIFTVILCFYFSFCSFFSESFMTHKYFMAVILLFILCLYLVLIRYSKKTLQWINMFVVTKAQSWPEDTTATEHQSNIWKIKIWTIIKGTTLLVIWLFADTGASISAVNAEFALKYLSEFIVTRKTPLSVRMANGVTQKIKYYVNIPICDETGNVHFHHEFYLLPNLNRKFLASYHLLRKLKFVFPNEAPLLSKLIENKDDLV